MRTILLGNMLAWGLQVAAIAALGLVLPVLFRLTSPKARLVYLRGLLLVCLALPVMQPWVPLLPAALDPADSPTLAFGEAGVAAPPSLARTPVSRRWPPEMVIGAVYVAGLAGRLAWMGLGLWSLARLRRGSRCLMPRPAAVDDAALMVGQDADFRVSDRVTRPATFGLRHPVVLVPPGFAGFSPAQQTAIAAHELLHVRRRDWVRALGDRLLLSVCWFHPVLWWLIEQIHLSVEQVVDREVVGLVGERRPYLEALLKLAEAGPMPVLQPASLFLKHGHLAQRVALLVREASMSRVRLVLSFVVVLALLVTSGVMAVQAWPLRGLPEPVVAGEPLSGRSLPGDGLLALVPVATELPEVVPEAAVAQQTKPTVDPKMQAPRPGMPPPPPPPPPQREKWDVVPANAVRVGGAIKPPARIKDVKPVFPEAAQTERLQGVVILEVLINEEGKVQATRVLRSIPLLDEPATTAVRGWEFTPTLLKGVPVPVVMAVTVNFTLTGGSSESGASPKVPPPPPPAPKVVGSGAAGGVTGGVARVGGTVPPPTKIVDVRPVYPPEAKEAGIQGVVIIETTIDRDGKVRDTKVLRSVPQLDQAAVDAVRQWEFTPTVVDGAAVPVIMTVTVSFKL
jgi:TonB family protein